MIKHLWGKSIRLVYALAVGLSLAACGTTSQETKSSQTMTTSSQLTTTVVETTQPSYQVSAEEKAYLAQRFEPLTAANPDTIAYVYAPGTMLDEPVVQTGDNSTYLQRTFDGGYDPYMGTVFMETANQKTFTDRLTWLFGHARGSTVPDHRMFNDVNFYDDQSFFDSHPYVVIETPERRYYYEAAFFIIVPETTAFYRVDFQDDQDFVSQLTQVRQQAVTQKTGIEIKAEDRYMVLSTCREEDPTIRANLYLRQIPDQELPDFLAKHQDQLTYKATR